MRAKQKLAFVVVLAVVILIAVIKVIGHKDLPFDSAATRSKGSEQAKVQVVEFIDLQCPACVSGVNILNKYLDKHPKEIRVQVKYYPLIKHHSHAMSSALYAECAGHQGKFWEFLELLIKRQEEWSSMINADPIFQEIAKEIRLDMTQLNICIAAVDTPKVINDDLTLGKSLGIQSTPTYFINNKLVVGTKSLTEELNVYFPDMAQDVP